MKRPNNKNNKKNAKKPKLNESCHTGHVLTLGQGDTGQLGLGPDVLERVKPGRVNLDPTIKQIAAGGMHTVCLTADGEVYTFGCNDDAALGRQTNSEEESEVPEKVDLPAPIKYISAGDSHTAALTEDGHVYIWGTFRDSNGSIGLCPGTKVAHAPLNVHLESKAIKIASGNDHLCCLTENGELYTMGNSEQGQLGRVAEYFSVRGGRKGVDYLLKPGKVHFQKKATKISEVWTSQYGTYAKDNQNSIHSWGLNNYYQAGFDDMKNRFVPELPINIDPKVDWKSISGGQHHALLLDDKGSVYALGRHDYGRLGLGENTTEKNKPTIIKELTDVLSIEAGTAVSFCVDKNGDVFAWGMGSSQQLGQRDDDDLWSPEKITGKQLENRKSLMVSAGGQHTVILAADNNNNE